MSGSEILCSECNEPIDRYATIWPGKMLAESYDGKERLTPLCGVCYIAELMSVPREWVLDEANEEMP